MNSSVKQKPLSGAALKAIALICMIFDHIGYLGLLNWWWLRQAGRIAFPIFCFCLVEGFYHTHSARGYALRMLLFALITEPCFNFMCTSGRSFAYPAGQNVMFTLLIGIGVMYVVKQCQPLKGGAVFVCCAVAAGCCLAELLKTDYSYYGILLIAGMYLAHGSLALNALCIVGFVLIMPYYPAIIPFWPSCTLSIYAFALLAIIPIALYNGSHGSNSSFIKYAFYAAYPLHMLILTLIERGISVG